MAQKTENRRKDRRKGDRESAGINRLEVEDESRADNCYDNTFMESCFGTTKRELEMVCYETGVVARKEIFDYIRYYNTRRRHSSLDYQTPVEFEDKQTS